MGMSIEEIISELKWVRKVNEEILKADAKEIDVDSAWIKHWGNVVESLDVAIDTMHKYQKIEEIINAELDPYICNNFGDVRKVQAIREVLEDGND